MCAGSLLTLLMKPIYWSTIAVGSLYHRTAMTRAMCGRNKLDQDSLPVDFRLNQPRLSPVSQQTQLETRLLEKAPRHAVTWLEDSDHVEVIDTSTGKQYSGAASRLCKVEMFRLFAETWNQLSSSQELPSVYIDAKKMASDYQAAKITLYKAFRDAGVGSWMERPAEQEDSSAADNILKFSSRWFVSCH